MIKHLTNNHAGFGIQEKYLGFAFVNELHYLKYWWYLMLTVFLIAGLLLVIHYMRGLIILYISRRIELIKKQEYNKLRREMAMDFHDEMGSKLALIIASSSYLVDTGTVTDYETRMLLKQIFHSSKELYNGTRDFIWTLNSTSITVHQIFDKLSFFGADLFENTDFDFETRRLCADSKLNAGVGRQILLIFKEAMTNALKHSCGTKVSFSVKEFGEIVFSLKDNGSGQKKSKSTGIGIKNMLKRSERLNSKLLIERTVNGTEIILKLNRKTYAE